MERYQRDREFLAILLPLLPAYSLASTAPYKSMPSTRLLGTYEVFRSDSEPDKSTELVD